MVEVARSLTVRMSIVGLRETLAALNRLEPAANKAMRVRSKALSQVLANRAQAAAQSDGAPQSRLVAPTIKARMDRLPVIAAGGSKRVGRRRVPVYKVLFGSEFGSNRYRQFRRGHAGRDGYWFFPTVENNSADVIAAWRRAADDVVRDFTADGGGR